MHIRIVQVIEVVYNVGKTQNAWQGITYNRSGKTFVLPLWIQILLDSCALIHLISVNGEDNIRITLA
jgi:hypothetical protein